MRPKLRTAAWFSWSVPWATLAHVLSVHGLVLVALAFVGLAIVRTVGRGLAEPTAEFVGDVAEAVYSRLRRWLHVPRRRDTERQTTYPPP